MGAFTYENQVPDFAWLWMIGRAFVALVIVWFLYFFLRQWLKKNKSRQLFLHNRTIPRLVQNLKGSDFEIWTQQLFLSLGAKAVVRGGRGDHGVDLEVTYRGKRIGVQCKLYYGDKFVGEHMVRDLYGVKNKEGFEKVILITTGNFSREAILWAREAGGLVLINAKFLERIILNRNLLLEEIK